MKISIVYLSCIALVLVAILSVTEARGIWGAKWKRDKVEEAEVESDGEMMDGFEASRRKFETRRQNSVSSTGQSLPQLRKTSY